MHFFKATLFALFSVACVSAVAIPVNAGEGSASLGAPIPCDPTSVANTVGKACTIKDENASLASRASARPITVFNDTPNDIRVSVSRHGGDGGKDVFFIVVSGSKFTFNRVHEQVVYVTRSGASGTFVETHLGVPGQTVTIL